MFRRKQPMSIFLLTERYMVNMYAIISEKWPILHEHAQDEGDRSKVETL